MTPLGPTTMTDAPNSPDEEYYPEFRTVRRGYDPDEVERVLDELYTALNEAAREVAEQTAKVRSTERVQEELRRALTDAQIRNDRDSFETVGWRVSTILDAAATEAAEITSRAHEEAQALHDESETTAVTSRAEADHYATDVRERAERAAVAITAAAHTEAERILADALLRRESQQRADAEEHDRVVAELADRQTQAEGELASATAAHEQRIVSLQAQIDAATRAARHRAGARVGPDGTAGDGGACRRSGDPGRRRADPRRGAGAPRSRARPARGGAGAAGPSRGTRGSRVGVVAVRRDRQPVGSLRRGSSGRASRPGTRECPA